MPMHYVSHAKLHFDALGVCKLNLMHPMYRRERSCPQVQTNLILMLDVDIIVALSPRVLNTRLATGQQHVLTSQTRDWCNFLESMSHVAVVVDIIPGERRSTLVV